MFQECFKMLQGFCKGCLGSLRLCTDMFERDRKTLPKDIGAYDCGFPCQPYSLLHNKSKLFGEEDAEVFRETMRTIFSAEPLIAVLENVVGILRVWKTVEKYLAKQKAYLYTYLVLDPRKLGDCVSRRRVYILLLHRPLDFSEVKVSFNSET